MGGCEKKMPRPLCDLGIPSFDQATEPVVRTRLLPLVPSVLRAAARDSG